MSDFQGRFVWCELMTDDAPAAAAFYSAAIGWGATDSGMTNRNYTILNAGEIPIGGLMELPDVARKAGARPGWTGYIAVDDVDGIAAGAAAAGGAVLRAADDIPGVGRFAIVADPQGASFTLFRPANPGPTPPEAGTVPGRVGWHELHAADREAAFAFYAKLFGWTKDEAIDMGPAGTYQLFAIGGRQAGGMMTRMDAARPPAWLYYFNVDAIDAAVARVKEAGGQILSGPHQVPGGTWIAHCLDPQGVLFAITGMKA